MPKEKKPSPNKKKADSVNYMKYSGMAFQMGIIILVGTFIGKKLDAHFLMEKPLLTVLFALLSIFAALYTTLKDILRNDS